MDGNSLHEADGEARLRHVESELALLRAKLEQNGAFPSAQALALAPGGGQEDKLSLIVFSGSLDRLIAAFVLATGAAAMGMQVSMFFTFWGTAALRRDAEHLSKSWLERLFGWMLPKGSRRLPLSQMNMGGGGPLMIRYIMKQKGVASVEEMIKLAAELGVVMHVCSMSMDLLGMKEAEMLEYPGLSYCGVAKFLETAAPGKITLFV
ncbi:MAG TPA: DsrE/DsrF/DrsH-like family protein [Polyangiaceae bacterium]|nr:DsrE/DsrF/DrsH-like family protein [Polyangiaceae bacterium]